MTISPPAKVKTAYFGQASILCSNLDKLDLSIDVTWLDNSFFKRLTYWKNYAKNNRQDFSVSLLPYPAGQEMKCLVKPFGKEGYEWFLVGSEYTLRIGNWMEPGAKPSVFAEISSETLWRLGPKMALKRLLSILRGQGASIVSIKPSRVDLCVDMLMDEGIWKMDLIQYRVTRSAYCSPHFHKAKMTGMSIGKGKVSAKLYDKPLEIKQQSKKYWMFPIWGLEKVPDGKRIIRTEFQLMREAIKDLGIDKIGELFASLDNVWAYCTQKWLKFQSNPGKHHTQRKTFPWWITVQSGFSGNLKATPLIRFKASAGKEEQLFSQAYGLHTSIEAQNLESWNGAKDLPPSTLKMALNGFRHHADTYGKGAFNFMDEVERKRAKYQRTDLKMLEVDKERRRHGMPSNFTDEQLKRATATQERLNLQGGD
ncbi:MAG: hypothetical protein JEZ11_21995 [Desulfobacterales bacterium]|nr:hypothetical protein [Desulfobacterales bacterium]